MLSTQTGCIFQRFFTSPDPFKWRPWGLNLGPCANQADTPPLSSALTVWNGSRIDHFSQDQTIQVIFTASFLCRAKCPSPICYPLFQCLLDTPSILTMRHCPYYHFIKITLLDLVAWFYSTFSSLILSPPLSPV